MSALEACRLFVGARFFMRWEAKDEEAPLQCVVVNRVELFADRNPRRLLMHVMRANLIEEGHAGVNLTIHQRDEQKVPTLTFTESGDVVSWAMPPQVSDGVDAGVLTMSQSAKRFDSSPLTSSFDMTNAYQRPMRILSYDVYEILTQFPSVSGSDMESFGSMIRKDLRKSTSCTLLEWES